MATLLIIKGSTNWLCVTAKELSTSDSDNYKFVFSDDQQKKLLEVTLPDQSDYKDDYNLFQLIEGTTVTFPKIGQGMYIIYDSNDVQVEIGKFIVLSEQEAVKYLYPYKNENNFIYS